MWSSVCNSFLISRSATPLVYVLTPSLPPRLFAYAGSQAGDQCLCGNTYGSQGQAPESDCNIPCAGDSNEMCGGPFRNSIYATSDVCSLFFPFFFSIIFIIVKFLFSFFSLFAQVGFVGCFIDSNTRDLPHQLNNINDIDDCRIACADAGYSKKAL
jgi:hypothetical protein